MADGSTFLNPKKRQKSKFSLSDINLEGDAGANHRAILSALPTKHDKEKAQLRAAHESHFYHWLYLLK